MTRLAQHTIDLQKPLLLLRILRNIDMVSRVFDAEFFQCTANFVAVWCTVAISTGYETLAGVVHQVSVSEVATAYKSMSVLGAMSPSSVLASYQFVFG